MTQHFLKFHSPTHRKFVIAPALQMGSSEGQRGHHHLLHQTDPGGAQISPWQPNCPQGHQGERSSDLVSPFMEWSGPACMKQDRNLCSHWQYWVFYFMCALGRQRLDQHLQRSLEDLRLWDLQAFSRNQSLHRDIRWSGNGSKHILILLSFKFQTKLECLAFSVVFNRNSSVHGPRDYRPGASGLWEAGWYLVSGVHHHRNGDGQNAVPRAGKSSGRHVQGTSGDNLEMNTIQGTFLILQKSKWKCDMANLCLLLSYESLLSLECHLVGEKVLATLHSHEILLT